MACDSVKFDDLIDGIRASRLPSPAVMRKIREVAGVTIREGAEHLSVAPMTYLRWERGDVQPRREHAIAYRQFLDALCEAVS
jgi:DNA-binding XRE family transcriptional regulator